MKATAFTGGVIGAIDCFLNVTAGLFQDLAHFARHIRGVLILVTNQNLTYSKQDLSATWRRHATPTRKRLLCGVDCIIDILSSGKRESTDYGSGIGRIEILKAFAGAAVNPFAANKVFVLCRLG